MATHAERWGRLEVTQIFRIHRRKVLKMLEMLHQGACQAIQEASPRDGSHEGSHDLGCRLLGLIRSLGHKSQI